MHYYRSTSNLPATNLAGLRPDRPGFPQPLHRHHKFVTPKLTAKLETLTRTEKKRRSSRMAVLRKTAKSTRKERSPRRRPMSPRTTSARIPVTVPQWLRGERISQKAGCSKMARPTRTLVSCFHSCQGYPSPKRQQDVEGHESSKVWPRYGKMSAFQRNISLSSGKYVNRQSQYPST